MIAKIFVTLALLAVTCSAGVAPIAPVIAPAAAAYVNSVPYNVPPYASSINIVNRGLASPYAAAPYVAAAPYFAGPHVAAPYTAAAAPYVAAASYPYASYPYASYPYASYPYVAAPLLK